MTVMTKKQSRSLICPICSLHTPYSSQGSLYRYHVMGEHNISETDYYRLHVATDPNCHLCACGKEKHYISLSQGYTLFCNPKCSYRKAHCLEKKRKTSLERYGNANYVNTEKRVKTRRRRYGPKMEKISEKILATKQERYGDAHFNNIQQTRKTKLMRYGNEFYLNEKQQKETNLERYGVSSPLHDPTIYQKTQKTRYQRVFAKMISQIDTSKYKVLSFLRGVIQIRCLKCGKDSTFSRKPLEYRLAHHMELCYGCLPKDQKVSSLEKEMVGEIKQLFEVCILTNVRIKNIKELDVLFPDQKIALEMNGLYYHSDQFKRPEYHLIKSQECEKIGIRLLHIFEDEWLYKRELVLSILRSALKVPPLRKVYGRKCVIKSVSTPEERAFLDENHIQGYVASKVSLGLYLQDALVSIMSFGSARFKNHDYQYELLRFCSLKNTYVAGAAGKLFQAFLAQNKPNSILSYCDRRLFSGDVYPSIGMTYLRDTEPNYYYIQGDQRFNRFKFRKSQLIKSGFSPTKSEAEIMRDREFHRIYDCGNKVYVWRR